MHCGLEQVRYPLAVVPFTLKSTSSLIRFVDDRGLLNVAIWTAAMEMMTGDDSAKSCRKADIVAGLSSIQQ